MSKTLPISEVKARLPELVNRVQEREEEVVVTRNGKPAAVLLNYAEYERLKETLEEILARHTGQPQEKIATDTDRDFVMTADAAKDYGIIDEILVTRHEVDNSGPISAVS